MFSMRRVKWVVVLLGIVAAGFLGSLAGKLGPLENNSPDAFLPSGAASTEVLHYQEAHGGRATTPAAVVYERQGGLRQSDLVIITQARTAVGEQHLPGATVPSPLIVSHSKRAATFSVPIAATTSQTTVADDVKAIRGEVTRDAVLATKSTTRDELRVAIGGPAGSAADAVDAFSGIDGRLLKVTVLVVALLLLLIYRSPILWLLPLVSVGLAAAWSEGLAYGLAKVGFVVNGMTVGILTVLVFGAGTDYALLLVARYREELRREPDPHRAMAVALRRAGPAIVTSGLTVVLALICLLAAQLNDVAALGPALAGGIVCALVAQLVFLPALLLVAGRRAFWPFVPRPGDGAREDSGVFGRLGRGIERRPRPAWVGLLLLLGACCIGLVAYQGGVNQQNGFVGKVGSVEAAQILSANFPDRFQAPTTVLVRPPERVPAALAASRATPGVASVSPSTALGDARFFEVELSAAPATADAEDTVVALRSRLGAAVGDHALVGGETATNVDLAAAASHDRNLLLPLILAVVLVMLGALLRSVVAPVLLAASVLLSYVASLGIGAVVFTHLLGFPGVDPTVPIFGFVFLVALGVDYSVFLMTRVREEAVHGNPRSVAKGLAVTGAVITSAGIVLAATFSVLAVLPLVALTEVGFVVAFGVLLDTILVRSVLVPALSLELGPRLWWPSALARTSPSLEEGDARRPYERQRGGSR